MPRGCVIYMPSYIMLYSQWCMHTSLACVSVLMCIIYIHIGVGLLRCSFRQDGQFPGASEREASDSAGLHAFFMPLLIQI